MHHPKALTAAATLELTMATARMVQSAIDTPPFPEQPLYPQPH